MAQKQKNNKHKNNADDLESYGAERLKMQKFVAWVAILGLVATTAITFGVVPLLTQ